MESYTGWEILFRTQYIQCNSDLLWISETNIVNLFKKLTEKSDLFIYPFKEVLVEAVFEKKTDYNVSK